jgi:hypothetical protein
MAGLGMHAAQPWRNGQREINDAGHACLGFVVTATTWR